MNPPCDPTTVAPILGRDFLSPLQAAVVQDLRLCKFLNRQIVQDEHLPNDKDGSVARDLLRRTVGRQLLERVEIKRNDFVVNTAPLYVPSEAGCCLLATPTGDMSLLLDRRPTTTCPQNFPHYLARSRLLLELRHGSSTQNALAVRMLTEHCVVNPLEPDAKKRRRLLTVVGKGQERAEEGGEEHQWTQDQ